MPPRPPPIGWPHFGHGSDGSGSHGAVSPGPRNGVRDCSSSCSRHPRKHVQGIPPRPPPIGHLQVGQSGALSIGRFIVSALEEVSTASQARERP